MKLPCYVDRLMIVVTSTSPHVVELFSGVVLVGVAIVLALTPGIWERSTAFTVIAQLAPRTTWATIMLMCGTAQLMALLGGGKIQTRLLATAFAAGIYLVFTWGLALAAEPTTGIVTWGGISALVLWATWRLRTLE